MTAWEVIIGAAQLGVTGMAVLLWSHVQEAKQLAKGASKEAENAKRAVSDHRVEVARDYATNADIVRFEHKLDILLEKLERKVDK